MSGHHYKWALGPGLDHSSLSGDIADIEAEHALCGPDSTPDAVVISHHMGKSFDALLAAYVSSVGIPDQSRPVALQVYGSPLREHLATISLDEALLIDAEHDHARVVRIPDNDVFANGYMMLVGCPDPDDPPALHGLLLDADLSVSKHHRNLGLGSALAAAQILDQGGLQVWEHDKHGFTDGGAACARRGLHLAQSLIPPAPLLEP